MREKGFSSILILVGIIILGLIGGVYYFGKSLVKLPYSGTNILPSPMPQSTPQPSPTNTTVVKGDSYSENTSVPNQKKYVSPKLGLSFLYLSQVFEVKIVVKEVDNRIYIYSTTLQSYKDGQFVEVFDKDKNATLAEAIKKQFLNGVSEKDCFVEVNKISKVNKMTFKYYPESYSTAEIMYPKTDDPNSLPWLIPAACPANYSRTNGMRYFLANDKHPNKLLFFSIGQYGIDAGEEDKLWQDTIQFLD